MGNGDVAPRPGERGGEGGAGGGEGGVQKVSRVPLRKVALSEAEVKLAKCRHAESWPTFFVSYVLYSTEFLCLGGGVRPRAGEKVYL